MLHTQFVCLDCNYSSLLLAVLVALLTRPSACRYSMSPVKALQESGSSGLLECYGSSKSSSTSRCYSCNHAKHFSAFLPDITAMSQDLSTSARARCSCIWQLDVHATTCDLVFSLAGELSCGYRQQLWCQIACALPCPFFSA